MTDDDRRFDTDDPTSMLPAEVSPPPDLRGRVVERLRRERLLTAPARPWKQWTAAAAALVVAFFAGRASAPVGSAPPAPVPPSAVDPTALPSPLVPTNRWALFLYQDAPLEVGGLSFAEVEGEYVGWAQKAADAGTLVLAERLDEMEFVVDSDAPPRERMVGTAPPPGVLTGMFIIEAPDLETAIETARSSPHRAFGGIVLIRPIDPI
ncbi:hypothetical protein V3331_14190 [Gaopeijia maritima]|uniref:hypothetical protein n=1 Tax=Gaopeijia maritima TaxID=3119007 RepID=UPI003245E77C